MQKENNVREFSSISLSHPPLFLNKNTYRKVKILATKNGIDFDTLLTELLICMLNHHKDEVKKIIKAMKR